MTTNNIKTNLATFDNSWYHPGPSWKIMLWYFLNVLFIKNSWNPSGKLKIFVCRIFGAKIGKGVIIKPGVNIKYPWLLQIGEYSWIGENVWIDNLDKVIIGANVCISQGALILCGNHNYKKSTFDLITGPITLEDGVWIGAKAAVCPGITAHSHSILTVNSVATRNLDPYTIYSGNPAQPIRKRIIKTIPS
jgi:putative colanic acid biosynthesis acetyltransferase WcaF